MIELKIAMLIWTAIVLARRYQQYRQEQNERLYQEWAALRRRPW